MSAGTKTRTWFDCPVSGQTRPTGFSGFTPYSSLGPQSAESCFSVTHSKWPDGRWEGGGVFRVDRDTYHWGPNPLKYQTFFGSGALKQSGTVRLESPTSAITPVTVLSHPSDAQLWANGSSAIARCEPTNPAFDLATNLGEIRADGIPSAMGSKLLMEKTKAAKAAGADYLNVEFGWLPLVSAVQGFASTVRDSDDILRNFQERANKPIHRRYDFPVVENVLAEPASFSCQPASAGFFTGGGSFQRFIQKKWFEGRFIYYLPTGKSRSDNFRRYGSYARKLLGIELTPETLWNLAPWSWAVDWFGNVGDVVHDASAFAHGLVMQYGYIMCHTRLETVWSGSLPGGPNMVKTRIQETKTRLPATPYGFGVSYDGLSIEQKAVVAALGLSKW